MSELAASSRVLLSPTSPSAEWSPSLCIAEISAATAAEWDEAWRECSYATYFHSREWAELWQRLEPESIAVEPKRVCFSDGATAVLPLVRRARARGLLTTYTSSMEGTFGGFISADALTAQHASLLADYLTEGLAASLSWRLNPYAPHTALIAEQLDTRCARLMVELSRPEKVARCMRHFRQPLYFTDDTHALNLEAGIGALFPNQSPTVRKAKKASKAGVQIFLAHTREHWKEYYQVYGSSVERWGDAVAKVYPWRLFEILFEAGSPNVKLWLASHGGRIISGAVCCYAREHVVYWHGSSLKEFFELRPVNLLMLEIIRHACAEGYRWFDFNPSGGLPGVAAFKESFGAKPLPCPIVYVDTPLKRIARAALIGYRGFL